MSVPASVPPDPILVVDLFPELRRRLLELLGGLSTEQWDLPTVCSGWSVKDVALHLLGGDLANLSRRRDGLSGALEAYMPADADPADPRTLVDAINRWNEDWVWAARRISTRVLCDLLAVTGDALHAYYRGLDLMAVGALVSWAGPEPAPVWLDVAREYTEQWTHQAQIRDAVGAPRVDKRRLFGPVLATFMHALPQALRGFEAHNGTCLRVIITGEAGGVWVALCRERRWVLGTDATPAATATVTLDQDTAWRLFTKGLPRDVVERSVWIDGDTALGSWVLDMVAIIG